MKALLKIDQIKIKDCENFHYESSKGYAMMNSRKRATNIAWEDERIWQLKTK